MKLLTVLKYTLKGSNALFFRGRRGGYLPLIISTIFFTLSFGFPVYIVNYEGFRRIVAFGVEEITVLSIAFWSFSISVLSVASFAPHMIYSLNFTDEALFLSTLPVSKFTLVLNSLFVSLISNTLLPIAYVFGLMGYAAAVGMNPLISLSSALANVLLITSLSLLIAVILLKWSGPSVKRLNLYVFLLDLILIVVMIQLNPVTLGTSKFAEAVSKLKFMWNILVSRWNPFYWPILALDDVLYIAPMMLLSVAFLSISKIISERIDFTRTHTKRSSTSTKGLGMLAKDVKLFLRKEQFFFFIVYPLIFSILYGHFTKSPKITVSINAVFSIFYTSVMAAINTQMELSTYPLHRTLPIKAWKILFPKVAIPVLVYSLLNACVASYALITGLSLSDFVFSTSFMTLAYTFASIMGVREFLKHPTSGRVVLPITSVFKVEFLSVGAVFIGLVYPLMWKGGGGVFKSWKVIDTFISRHGTLIAVVGMAIFTTLWSVEALREYEKSDS